MGASFTNYHVRTENAAALKKAVEASIAMRALVSDARNGWSTVYDEESEAQNFDILRRLAANLSKRLKTAVIATLVHDSDTFVYFVYDSGKLVDKFDSVPDYFGAVSDRDKKAWAGDPRKVLRYAAPKTTASQVVKALKQKQNFEEDRAAVFAPLFGIDPGRARLGFKFAQESGQGFQLVSGRSYSPDVAALVEAVSKRDLASVRALLAGGASPNQKDKFGEPLLVVAIRRGQLEIVHGLIAAGANIFAEVRGGGDALWMASVKGHEQIVPLLLEKCQGDAKFPARLSIAFGAAVMAGHADVIKLLIGAGADVNAKTALQQAPLMLAAMRGQEFIWKAKMKQAFPQRPGQQKTDWKQIVMILLDAGAQIPFPTKGGPIDVKSLTPDQRSKLADKLLEAGAKIKLPEGVC